MKKSICSIIVSVLFIVTSFTSVVFGDELDKGVLMQIDNTKGYLLEDTKETSITFAASPFIKSETTLVPLRIITESLQGEVQWNDSDKKITISLNENIIEMWIGNTVALVNGGSVTLQQAPQIVNGTTFIPVRFVSENIGLNVLYEDSKKAIFVSNYVLSVEELKTYKAFKNLDGYVSVKVTPSLSTTPAKDSVTYQKKSVSVSSGKVSADVISVDLKNPNVKFDVVMPNKKLNSTMSFTSIVNYYKPIAAINGNFFNAYGKIKDPVGSIMSNSEFLYASSGLTSMGITKNKEIIFGRPLVFTKFRTVDSGPEKVYTAYEINVLDQSGEQAILYTTARGNSVSINASGMIMQVENNTITKYFKVNVSDVVSIPSNGYVVFFSDVVTSYDYFQAPEVGRVVSISYEPFKVDEENFDLVNSVSIVSGAPRLVKGGQIDTSPLDSGFAGDSRFTTSSAPRTAVGKTNDGKLIFVSTSCTIDQLKEVMLGLNCVDALNLDGGGSTSMYFNGSYLKVPGRELTSVIVIG